VQSVTASSVALRGGWYSQSATQPASGPGAPASPGQMGGRVTHLPASGRGCVQTPPSPPPPPSNPGAPPSDCEPSAVSQYWPAGQLAAEVQSAPGVTHAPKRHTVLPVQQDEPQTSLA